MFLLNVFQYLTVTPSGPRCTTVVTWNELVHMSTWQPVPGIKCPLSVEWLNAHWKVIANKSAWKLS
jgi:hypothetical protein